MYIILLLVKLSNGYQHKWGYVSSPTNTYNLTFPTALSYSCYGLYLVGKNSSNQGRYAACIANNGTLSRTGCSSVFWNSSGYSAGYWFAVGY